VSAHPRYIFMWSSSLGDFNTIPRKSEHWWLGTLHSLICKGKALLLAKLSCLAPCRSVRYKLTEQLRLHSAQAVTLKTSPNVQGEFPLSNLPCQISSLLFLSSSGRIRGRSSDKPEILYNLHNCSYYRRLLEVFTKTKASK
jgi:hypothetical protein